MSRFTTSRRGFFAGAGLAASSLVLPASTMATASAQEAEASDMPDQGLVRRIGLGGFTILTVSDGMRPGDGPHPTFGEDQDPEAVAELMAENFLPETRFVNGFTPTLIDTGNEVILFDTGMGANGRANGMGRLRGLLEQAGYAPDSIDTVVLTHLHPDHIGGLWEGEEPAFPEADYVIGQAEYDHWSAEGAENVMNAVGPLAERTRFIGDGEDVVSGITGMAAFGHTPGHMIFHIESDGERLALTADTANHYVASLQRPDWHVAFDADKEAAAQTRRQVFGMIAADRIPFIGYHMPFPALGYVEEFGDGFRYVPATYQFDV
ncbi:MBL fold metallo-hydrolase [Pelagibacterium montanilacus]|uniref:MBL fold metallo-hydrolase n=1 Tax=Pelagibacterium montanilacus TaxID=2185280 RepID=UPI000F8C4D8D|nr:MBL fold metallo-hydrolase [Pelagibacterium montanilacus]